MKIELVNKETQEFKITYWVGDALGGFWHSEVVNYRYAQHLEYAKEAGRREKQEEIKRALGITK